MIINFRRAWLISFVALAVARFALAEPSNVNLAADCDIPTANIRTAAEADQTLCQTSCEKQPDCKGFVFVSGWNRCMQKSSIKVRNGIVMHGGNLKIEKDGQRIAESFGAETDNTGRDLKRIASTSSEMACQEHCRGEVACLGYVWIAGYKDCWLKKTKGSKLAKRFYCGTVEREKLISH